MFNALHGAQRLNFQHLDGRWPIDVVIDEVRMSHRIDLRGRLNGPGPTLTLADLLLTKLQIWEINPKDLGDVVCLLADHERMEAVDAIDRRRLLGVAGADWGLCHRSSAISLPPRRARRRAPTGWKVDLILQVAALLAAIDAAPKSSGARGPGRREIRWHETPEEVPAIIVGGSPPRIPYRARTPRLSSASRQ
jgi:hypothetical protein